MLSQDHLMWQANYKSMSRGQLVAELNRIAKNPHHYEERIERKAFIADQLALDRHSGPIILAE